MTKTALKRATSVDDHNGMAFTVLPDGRFLCSYAGGHNTDKDIHIRLSDQPDSIAGFSTEVVLESSGKTCYSQLLQSGGRVWLFYRVNNQAWAVRSTEDGTNWTDERILVRADMQYYCRFMPTTREGLFRVCMTSNPTGANPNIRMGFYDTQTGLLLDSDGVTVLGTERVFYDQFSILIQRPEGKTQRLFDVAVSEPERPRILIARFTNNKSAQDSVYYLYDGGELREICAGGKALWNPNYQGGAAFLGTDRAVAARNEGDTDLIELYNLAGEQPEPLGTVWSESSEGNFRNARPICDVNGLAFLWHRGTYDPGSYKNFYTDAQWRWLDEIR